MKKDSYHVKKILKGRMYRIVICPFCRREIIVEFTSKKIWFRKKCRHFEHMGRKKESKKINFLFIKTIYPYGYVYKGRKFYDSTGYERRNVATSKKAHKNGRFDE